MMELKIEKLRPGIFIAEKVQLVGGINYEREYEESYFEDKAEVREWTTISRIEDPEEREEGKKVCSRIYKMLRDLCVNTPVGLICEKGKEPTLKKTLQWIKEERDSFNSKAKTCQIITNYVQFEVKEDNTEALAVILDQVATVASNVDKAITSDDRVTLKTCSRKWLQGMTATEILALPENKRNPIIARAKAEMIRKVLKDLKGIDTLLPPSAGSEAKSIISESRKIARELCNKVEKRNESLNKVLDGVDLSGISKRRAAFVQAARKLG